MGLGVGQACSADAGWERDKCGPAVHMLHEGGIMHLQQHKETSTTLLKTKHSS